MGLVVHCYHGSDVKFDNFSLDFIGTGSGTTGAGFGIYFSELEAEAFTYGNNVYECVLNLKNNISNTEITFDKQFLQKLLDDLKLNNVDFYQHFTEPYLAIENLLNCSLSDTEIIGSIINACSGGSANEVFEVLCKYGYDHTIDDIESDDKTINHYIIYDVNSITITKQYTLETR